MTHRYIARIATLTALGALTACSEAGSIVSATDAKAVRASASANVAYVGGYTALDEQRDLATLRAATAGFHNLAAAKTAKYDFLFMNMCMVDESPSQLGGMGYHWVNAGLLDGAVDVAHPEALLYEPMKNGQARLVAVEYVIPKAAWNGPGKPVLFGRELQLNSFDLWALHVWVWESNPAGLTASWSRNVSCQYATDAAKGSAASSEMAGMQH